MFERFVILMQQVAAAQSDAMEPHRSASFCKRSRSRSEVGDKGADATRLLPLTGGILLPRADASGKGGPGGAKNYIVNGKMTEGFAFLAYPAEYRSSGVMTFIVSQDGIVYQRDLGKETGALAKATKEYNPNFGWERRKTSKPRRMVGRTQGRGIR